MAYSAIIVLGNLMSADGVLNTESASRMDVAIKAFHQKKSPIIITCGWAYRNDSPLTIASVMKSYAIMKGHIPSSCVKTEDNSRDTVGDAYFTLVNIIKNTNWKNLLVVTSDYHQARTAEIFQFIYGSDYTIEFISAETRKAASAQVTEAKSLASFHNTFSGIEAGDLPKITQRIAQKHPFYNGEIYPLIKS